MALQKHLIRNRRHNHFPLTQALDYPGFRGLTGVRNSLSGAVIHSLARLASRSLMASAFFSSQGENVLSKSQNTEWDQQSCQEALAWIWMMSEQQGGLGRFCCCLGRVKTVPMSHPAQRLEILNNRSPACRHLDYREIMPDRTECGHRVQIHNNEVCRNKSRHTFTIYSDVTLLCVCVCV